VHKCLNIHPSLLPKYRGASPVAAAILNGDAVTGVTLMLVEKVVDSGPILLQREIKVADDDTTESLTTKLAQLGAEMLVEILPDWLAGRITPVMQDHSQASFTHKESKEDGLMDWNLPAEQLWRRVRAFHPWPGSYILWKGNRVKIIKTMPIAVEIEAPPGQVVMLPRTYPVRVAVRAAGSVLGLITVQPEGKREMSGQEFASGHRDFIGSLL
jgi:methionyl-tRNA formyltransferase